MFDDPFTQYRLRDLQPGADLIAAYTDATVEEVYALLLLNMTTQQIVELLLTKAKP